MSIESLGNEGISDIQLADETIKKARDFQEQLYSINDEEEAQDFIESAIEHLNNMFPYINEEMYFDGDCILPTVNPMTEEFLGNVFRTGEHASGMHLGFDVETIDYGNGYPPVTQFMHKLMIMQEEVELSKTFVKYYMMHAFFTLNSRWISVKAVEEQFSKTSVFNPEEMERKISILFSRSKSFSRAITSEKFMSLTLDEQIKKIDKLLGRTGNEVRLVDLGVAAIAKYGYVNDSNRASGFKQFSVNNSTYGEELIISGKCLAIDSLAGIVLKNKRIASRNDLIDRHSDLCIVIDPDYSTKLDYNLMEGQMLYVPLSKTSVLEAYDPEE